jgi:hypothetical protein
MGRDAEASRDRRDMPLRDFAPQAHRGMRQPEQVGQSRHTSGGPQGDFETRVGALGTWSAKVHLLG